MSLIFSRLLKALNILVIITAISVVQPAYGSNWPMAQCDSWHTGNNSAETKITPPLDFAWLHPGECAYDESRTRPVIADGIVYVGEVWSVYAWGILIKTECQLQAISLASGKAVWTAKNLPFSGTPVFANRHVYVGTTDGSVYALNAVDGSILWRTSVAGMPATPVVLGNMLVLSTSASKVYSLDAMTGEVRWVVTRPTYLTAPTLTNNSVFVGGGELLALDAADGHIKWSFNSWKGHSMPVVSGSSVFTAGNLGMYCLDADTGAIKWSRTTADVNGASESLSVGRNTLYAGTVTAYDIGTGEVKWTFDVRNKYRGASVALANGYVFIGSTRPFTDAVVDSSDGRLYVLDQNTGELAWRYEAGGRYSDWYLIDPSPAIADGSVILNLSRSQMCCFSTPQRSSNLGVSVNAPRFNPYDLKNGSATISFTLANPATVTVDVMDYQGTVVRQLAQEASLPAGEHHMTWCGLKDFPEMVDPELAAEFGDRCIRVAPDGSYRIVVTAIENGMPTLTGSADVEVKGDV
ncbi:MAG TPA: PQQ-binding-like beta-propeller repeat protein [Candidatus Aquicultor sp.]|jgi:outer membrane protein assembly factor BamB